MKWLLAIVIQASLITFIASSEIAPSVQHGLIILSIIAHCWLAELLPLSVTALLVPVLAVLFDVMDFKDALRSFAHPIIFLFLGGFALAAALHEHKLDKQFAQTIMQKAKNQGLVICILLFLLTAFLSMWISNTATTVMMLPIALGIMTHLKFDQHMRTFAFVLLGVAYSANIGGIATIVGSPPNAIAASALGLSFNDWLIIALPISIVALPTMWALLYLLLRPNLNLFSSGASPTEPFVWHRQTIAVMVIFIVTASLWVFGGFIQKGAGKIADFDSWVAVIAIIALHASKSLSWQSFEKQTQWGVLILFGGGLALSAILSESQANLFLAQQLSNVGDYLNRYGLLLLVILFVIFMTEISSNTALSALMIPTFMGMADVLNIDQTMIVSAIAVAASCAFMLPVATPPNAIVFSSGYVPQNTMMKTGFMLNILFSFLLSSYFFLL